MGYLEPVLSNDQLCTYLLRPLTFNPTRMLEIRMEIRHVQSIDSWNHFSFRQGTPHNCKASWHQLGCALATYQHMTVTLLTAHQSEAARSQLAQQH